MVILTLENTDNTPELYFGNLRYYTSEYKQFK